MDDGWIIIISAQNVGMDVEKRSEKPLNKEKILSLYLIPKTITQSELSGLVGL